MLRMLASILFVKWNPMTSVNSCCSIATTIARVTGDGRLKVIMKGVLSGSESYMTDDEFVENAICKDKERK
jgi:hypothetical protein